MVDKHESPELTRILNSVHELPMQFTVGRSVVTQFASGHDPSDVLEELVQNEYDAGGDDLQVAFGQDSLTITGNGAAIDEEGWSRLSVMLGTGEVAGGDGRFVKAKHNSIGSKNFGLRSLFLYGDRIAIASGGYQTVLDAGRGTLEHPVEHTESRRRKGVIIQVPYRLTAVDGLPPFDELREREALDRIAGELPLLLIKLAAQDKGRSLGRVRVDSLRAGRRLSWKQFVRRVPTKAGGVTALQRVIEARDGPLSQSRGGGHKITELEFQRDVVIPSEFRGHQFPEYYRVARNRLRVAVSVLVRGNRLDLDSRGIFFYPLGMRSAYTGSRVNVSAPFDLDQDRSQVVDSTNSPWNKWLLIVAGDLTLDLIIDDWFQRFGPPAYRLLQDISAPQVPDYSETIEAGMSYRAVWPSQARRPRGTVFVRATDLVIPHRREFFDLLEPKHYLDPAVVDDSEVVELARSHGAKDFTVNSLVRLRCAGSDQSGLETEVPVNEANYHYPNFPVPLRREQTQLKTVRALDACYRNLSQANRSDLADTPTTLTASGHLAAARPLWWVDARLERLPLRPDEQLHPALAASKAMRRLCRQFDVSKWAANVSERINNQKASEEERDALYGYLTATHIRLNPKAILNIRRSTVLRDHKGRWVAPRDITLPTARYADRLAQVLHFPNKDFASDQALARTLRFRKKVRGEDLVEYAELVSESPSEAARFERVLEQVLRLVTPRVLSRLKTIPFLRTTQGDLGSPADVYVRTPLTLACLGDMGRFPADNRIQLYRRLKCRTMPDSKSILDHLKTLAIENLPPKEPETLYSTLSETLRRERPLDSVSDEPILWTGRAYAPPVETLVGRLHSRTFFDSVPIFLGSGTLMRIYESLGASRQPQSRHWKALMAWMAESFAGQTLARHHRDALLQAYANLSEIGDTILITGPCLLDRKGLLHPLTDAKKNLYLVDDDPLVAEQLEKSSTKIAFALTSAEPRVRRFYTSVGVRRITDVRRAAGVQFGEEIPAPHWVPMDRLLARLGGRVFITAVEALVTSERHQVDGKQLGLITGFHRRVERIVSLQFKKDMHLRYSVSGVEVLVPTAFYVDETGITLKPCRSRSDLYDGLAQALASLVSSDIDYARSLSDAIYRLLRCESDREIADYLRSRGVTFPWAGEPENPEDSPMEDWEEDDATDVVERLTTDLVRAGVPPEASGSQAGVVPESPRPTAHSAPPPTLPPLDTVVANEIATTNWFPSEKTSGSGGTGGGWWTPRTPDEQERDRVIGKRAEELILREERKRVAGLGYPEDRVVWTSQNDESADHDISSVDEDGEDLWIEVKGTLGRSGSFQWSVAEFKKALHERSRYVLVRVYDVASSQPQFKRFRDPIALYRQGDIRLDISSLSGQVEPA